MNKIVTTYSKKYWDRTGKYTVKNWIPFLNNTWQLILHDTPTIPDFNHGILLNSNEKNLWVSKAKNKVNQQSEPVGFMKEWEKFCHKSFAQWETYEYDNTGILIWCDADVKFKKHLSVDFIKECLDNKFCAYLGRDRVDTQHPLFKKRYGQYKKLTPETCFIIYDLDHEIAKDFFESFKKMYISMELFTNYSWCDAGAFISTVEKFDKKYFNDLSPTDNPSPLPLNQSKLDNYIEHWIGTQNKKQKKDIIGKELARSMNNDINYS